MQYINEENFDDSQKLNSNERVIPRLNSDRAKVLLPFLNGNQFTKPQIIAASQCLGSQARISELRNDLHWPIMTTPVPFRRADGKEVTIALYSIPNAVLQDLLKDEQVKAFVDAARKKD